MKIWTLRLVISACLSVSILAANGSRPGSLMTEKGFIAGQIIDLEGKSVHGATISIVGEGQSYVARSDNEGKYRQEVTPGIYQITFRRQDFETTKRSAFTVRAGAVSIVDMLLIFEGSHLRGFAYDSFESNTCYGPAVNLAIRYREGYRWSRGNNLEYRGAGSENAIHRGVMATFDLLAIYANKIELDKGRLYLVADDEEGLVIIGDRYVHFRHLEVDFKLPDPISGAKIDGKPLTP